MRYEAHFYGVTIVGIAAAVGIGLLIPDLAIAAGVALVAGYVWYCIYCWKARPNP